DARFLERGYKVDGAYNSRVSSERHTRENEFEDADRLGHSGGIADGNAGCYRPGIVERLGKQEVSQELSIQWAALLCTAMSAMAATRLLTLVNNSSGVWIGDRFQ